MGRLAGFRYRDITRRLKALGLEFHRQAAGSLAVHSVSGLHICTRVVQFCKPGTDVSAQ